MDDREYRLGWTASPRYAPIAHLHGRGPACVNDETGGVLRVEPRRPASTGLEASSLFWPFGWLSTSTPEQNAPVAERAAQTIIVV